VQHDSSSVLAMATSTRSDRAIFCGAAMLPSATVTVATCSVRCSVVGGGCVPSGRADAAEGRVGRHEFGRWRRRRVRVSAMWCADVPTTVSARLPPLLQVLRLLRHAHGPGVPPATSSSNSADVRSFNSRYRRCKQGHFLQDQDQLPTEKALGAYHNVTTKRYL